MFFLQIGEQIKLWKFWWAKTKEGAILKGGVEPPLDETMVQM